MPVHTKICVLDGKSFSGWVSDITKQPPHRNEEEDECKIFFKKLKNTGELDGS